MRRRILLIILAFGLLAAQGMLVAESVLCNCCPCSAADDNCPRGCESCVGASMARLIVPNEPAARTLSPVGEVHPSPVVARRLADPQDIFHVPRVALS